MNNVTLEWEKVEDIDSIRKLDDTEFYAFTQDNTLLYIGIAYFQDVADEIKLKVSDLFIPLLPTAFDAAGSFYF